MSRSQDSLECSLEDESSENDITILGEIVAERITKKHQNFANQIEHLNISLKENSKIPVSISSKETEIEPRDHSSNSGKLKSILERRTGLIVHLHLSINMKMIHLGRLVPVEVVRNMDICSWGAPLIKKGLIVSAVELKVHRVLTMEFMPCKDHHKLVVEALPMMLMTVTMNLLQIGLHIDVPFLMQDLVVVCQDFLVEMDIIIVNLPLQEIIT